MPSGIRASLFFTTARMPCRGPKVYSPSGMPAPRIASVTIASFSWPLLRNASSSISRERCLPSVINSEDNRSSRYTASTMPPVRGFDVPRQRLFMASVMAQ